MESVDSMRDQRIAEALWRWVFLFIYFVKRKQSRVEAVELAASVIRR